MAFGRGEYLTGYESLRVSSAAISLTDGLLSLAFAAEITVDGGAVRFRTDGTAATAVGPGSVLKPSGKLVLNSATEISNFSVIRNGEADATLRVTYFKLTPQAGAFTTLSATGAFVQSTVTALDNTGTPTVAASNLFDTGGTQAILDFDDGVVGQVIYITASHTVTVTDGSAIDLAAGNDYIMTPTDTLILCMFDDQVWHEMGRSVNGG